MHHSRFALFALFLSLGLARVAPAQELLLYFPLDGRDANNLQTISDASSKAPALVPGVNGNAHSFIGKTAVALPFNLDHANYPQITMTAWVREPAGASGSRTIVGTPGGMQMSINGGRLAARAGRKGVSMRDARLPSEQWVFVAAILDIEAGWIRLMQNGQVYVEEGLDGSFRSPTLLSDPTERLAAPQPWVIVGAAKFAPWQRYARPMLIDDVRVFSGVLGDDELRAIARRGVSPDLLPGDMYDATDPNALPGDMYDGDATDPNALPGDMYDGGATDPEALPGDMYDGDGSGPEALPGDMYDPSLPRQPDVLIDVSENLNSDMVDGRLIEQSNGQPPTVVNPTQLPGDMYDDDATDPEALPGDMYEGDGTDPNALPGDMYDGDGTDPEALPGDMYDPTQPATPDVLVDVSGSLRGDIDEGALIEQTNVNRPPVVRPTQLPGDMYDGDGANPEALPGDMYDADSGDANAVEDVANVAGEMTAPIDSNAISDVTALERPNMQYASEEEGEAAAAAAEQRRRSEAEQAAAEERAAEERVQALQPVGTYSPTGEAIFSERSGFRGEKRSRLDLQSEFVIRIDWREKNNRPCEFELTGSSGKSRKLDLCHGSSEGTFGNHAVFIAGQGGQRPIRAIKVCNNDNNKTRLKGIQIFAGGVNGSTERIDLPDVDADVLNNCAVWDRAVSCPANTLATGLIVHSNEPKLLAASGQAVGLQLVCRAIIADD